MKKHLLSFVLLALTLGFSANAWAEFTIKQGTYYIDLTGITMQQNATVEIFNDYATNTNLQLTSSSCNTNVTQTSDTPKQFKCSGQWPDYFVVELTSDTKIDNEGRSFVQIYGNDNDNNLSWKKYNEATSAYAQDKNCIKLTTSGYSWATISAPSCGGGGDEPTPTTTYYIKSQWGNDENWSWKEMSSFDHGVTWIYTDVCKGNGVNINTSSNDAGAKWFPNNAITGDTFESDDNVTFIYIVSAKTVSARNNSNPCSNCKIITKP